MKKLEKKRILIATFLFILFFSLTEEILDSINLQSKEITHQNERKGTEYICVEKPGIYINCSLNELSKYTLYEFIFKMIALMIYGYLPIAIILGILYNMNTNQSKNK